MLFLVASKNSLSLFLACMTFLPFFSTVTGHLGIRKPPAWLASAAS